MNPSAEGFEWTADNGLRAGIPTLGAIRPLQRVGSSDQQYDVIVVGAGYAGLTAARDLSTNGFRILLLEARDRIGGRTWSSNLGDYPFELGGTWVHWNQPHVYREISRYGLQEDLENSHDFSKGVNTFNLIADGQSHKMSRDQEGELMEKVVKKFVNVDGEFGKAVCSMPGSPDIGHGLGDFDRMSVADRLAQIELTTIERAALEGFLAITHGGKHEEASFGEFLRWWALNNYDMDLFEDQCLRYKFRSGQSNFARRFFDEALETGRLDYVLQAPVKSISDLGKSVIVTTRNNQTFTAQRSVCTIPLNVLKDVTFDPPLNALKLSTSQGGHVNKVSKTHVECANPELRSYASQIANPYDKLTLMFGDGTTPAGNTHLVSFGSSLPDFHLNAEDDIEETKRAFRAFLPDGQMDIKRIVFHNWARDEFAQGAWEFLRPGMIGDRRILNTLRQKQGNVHFASADWAFLWRGFIDGAIEDGARVAMDVKRELIVARTQR